MALSRRPRNRNNCAGGGGDNGRRRESSMWRAFVSAAEQIFAGHLPTPFKCPTGAATKFGRFRLTGRAQVLVLTKQCDRDWPTFLGLQPLSPLAFGASWRGGGVVLLGGPVYLATFASRRRPRQQILDESRDALR